MKFDEKVDKLIKESQLKGDTIKMETVGAGIDKPYVYSIYRAGVGVNFSGVSYSPSPVFLKPMVDLDGSEYKAIEKEENKNMEKAFKEINKVFNKADDEIKKIMSKYGYKLT